MKNQVTKVVLVGGGTGGHLTPLIALAKLIKQENLNWQLYYLGVKGDKIAKRLITADLFDKHHTILAGKWHRFGQFKKREVLYFWKKDFWLNLGNCFLLIFGFWQSFFYLKKIKPQIIFSKGGYVALPPCLAARFLKIPLVIHDSDTVLGLAHRLVYKHAALRLTGLKTELSRTRHVGIPVNPLFAQKLDPQAKKAILKKYQLPAGSKFILVTGGGAGALSLNQAIIDLADQLTLQANLYIVLLTGKKTYKQIAEQAQHLKRPNQLRLVEFVDDMPDLVRASWGVVTRAGATILTEVSLAGKPTIIIPNPLLPRAHQVYNGRLYQRMQAAWLVSDTGSQVNLRALKKALEEMLTDTNKRLKYQRNIMKLAIIDANNNVLRALKEVLADQVQFVAKKSNKEILKAKPSDIFLLRRLKHYLLYSLLAGLLLAALFKLFYINQTSLNLTENSPLVSQVELADLQSEIDDFMQNQQNFWRRYFFVDTQKLQKRLLQKVYLETVTIKRDLFNSRLSIDVTPKYILGSLHTPNLQTIITTDGYAISDYQHLLNQRHFALRIISPHQVISRRQVILSGNDLTFLNQINAYLASRGYQLIQASLSLNPQEMVLRLKDYELDMIVLTSQDPIQQGIALALALEFFESKLSQQALLGSQDAETTVLSQSIKLPQEFIDVRLIDRVIFK